jgi:hypothetical protein
MKSTVIVIVTMLLTSPVLAGNATTGYSTGPPSRPGAMVVGGFEKKCRKAGGHYTGSACECPKGSSKRWINPRPEQNLPASLPAKFPA